MVETASHETLVRTSLEKITVLEVGPHESLSLFRSIYDRSDKDQAERVYAAYRSAIWMLLAQREHGIVLCSWHDVLRQVAALYGAHDNIQAHDRLRVLSDLVSQSHRFGNIHSDIMSEPKVAQILQFLKEHADKVVCVPDLYGPLGIAPWVAIRVTNIMAAYGLIVKKGYGAAALLSLPQ